MITDKDIKRLKYIKDKLVFFDTKCDCCDNYFKFEKMWIVKRWGVNKTVHNWYYCHNCMPTKCDVLNEIDTDACIFGIFPIDSFSWFKKKNNTKIIERTKTSFTQLNDKTAENCIQPEQFICESNENCKYKKRILIKENK